MPASLRQFTKVQAAKTLVTDLKDDIDEYARKYRAIADEVWEKEYAQRFTRKIKSVRYA